MARFDGAVCVVTGAARGIGLAIAQRLGDEGGRIACIDVSADRLAAAVAGLTGAGIDARAYCADVGRRDAAREALSQVEEDFRAPATVLINNAAWARFQALDAIDEVTVDRMFDVGLKGRIWTLQAAVPQMKRQGVGSVVNVCSIAALRGMENSVAYAAMKAGVLGFTRAAAHELSAHRIRVNAIVPGMVGTQAALGQFDDATIASRRAAMPLGRFGEPREIAAAVAFLAGPEGSYIQGTALVADGGWTVGVP